MNTKYIAQRNYVDLRVLILQMPLYFSKSCRLSWESFDAWFTLLETIDGRKTKYIKICCQYWLVVLHYYVLRHQQVLRWTNWALVKMQEGR